MGLFWTITWNIYRIHLGLGKFQKLGEDLYCEACQKFWYMYVVNSTTGKKMKKICKHKLKKHPFNTMGKILNYNFKYRTRAIISRSWLEAALEYRPYIRTAFSEKTSLNTKKWSLEMG